MLLICGLTTAMAQKPAEIKFDKLTHNFGTFSEKSPVVTCTFTFTNTGNQPLIINEAMPSCGCTVPNFTKSPIAPGETGTIDIKFNAEYQQPTHFKKTITVLSNAKTAKIRLYIEGDIQE